MATYVENYQRVLKDTGKREGSQHTFYCPFPGCAGYKKRKFYVNPATGAWCCKHCMQEVPDKVYRPDCREPHGGSWKEFAIMMQDDLSLWPTGRIEDGEDRPEPLPAAKAREVWTKYWKECSLLPEHEALIRSRGIDPVSPGMVSASMEALAYLRGLYGDEHVIRAGLAYLNHREEFHPTRCVRPGRILIPYWSGKIIQYFVGYQPCPPRAEHQSEMEYAYIKANWAKYCGPLGYSPTIYGTVPDEAEYLIVTEGQLKALAAIQRGFPCVGLQGIGNNHRALVTKCKKKGVKRAIILFDTQDEHQETVDYEAGLLAGEFLAQGIPAYRAELPMENGQKADIDSYLLNHVDAEFAEILKEAALRRYVLPETPLEEAA